MAAEMRLWLLIVLVVLPCAVFAHSWNEAHATYYGAPEGTIGGACGFEEYKQIYSPYTAALSPTLYNEAESCGACFEIVCVNTTGFCKKDGEKSVVVTATDLCPASDARCSPPHVHFDLSQPAFHLIAEHLGGDVPVKYRKVSCKRKGGAKFTITGNPNFNLVTVTNVAGGGDVEKVEVKAEGDKEWKNMKRNWGEKWETSEVLSGKSLNFRVTTTEGGACGFEEYKKTYGSYTAAVSKPLFDNAAGCGACYEVRCVKNKMYCKKGHKSVVVTVTDLCPPGGWCSHTHFDLSQPAFLKIADQVAGHVPVMYRSVPCKRKGGEKFKISGNPFFNLVTVTNVGGEGDVKKLEVKPEGSKKWKSLKRNWGENWECDEKLTGKALTFKVTTVDGKESVSRNVAPKSWKFGQTFEGKNF
nr:Barwin-like endoglucanase [Ipomoea batatas]GME14573.1 Barwin-like endoglucanase [Ipomoea batatas]